MPELPINPHLQEVVEHLRTKRRLVLEAPPGAGKTTAVPLAILKEGLLDSGELWVLQPRRLAARMAAHRVAALLGEKVGNQVGYSLRFEDKSSPRTRIRFVTEGILTRRLLQNPDLPGIDGVLLDEFHERSLDADLNLALLRQLQESRRPELFFGIMSATLDSRPVAEWLQSPWLRTEGRAFEVELEHLDHQDQRPLPVLVASALRRALKKEPEGDVLIFLPGAAEIRRAMDACLETARSQNLLLLPLHGELSAREQDRAMEPAPQRKVIFSTNVAETSLTIDGVRTVIDSGLARIAEHSPWTGLSRLKLSRISKASARQRAGRAGRQAPGLCIRLYSRYDFETRPDDTSPEIRRLDLAPLSLQLRESGLNPRQLLWYETPDPRGLEAAETLLKRLGALDEQGNLSSDGQMMLRFPLHPRLSKMLLEGSKQGFADDATLLAALLSERDIRRRSGLGHWGPQSVEFQTSEGGRKVSPSLLHPRSRAPKSGEPKDAEGLMAWSSGPESFAQSKGEAFGESDPLDLLDLFREVESKGFSSASLRLRELDSGALRAVSQVYRQLRNLDRAGKNEGLKKQDQTSKLARSENPSRAENEDEAGTFTESGIRDGAEKLKESENRDRVEKLTGAGNRERAGKIAESGNRDPAGGITESGNRDRAGKVAESGNRDPAGKITESGNRDPAGKITESGNRDPAGGITESGNRDPAGKITEWGNRDRSSKSAQSEIPAGIENLTRSGKQAGSGHPNGARESTGCLSHDAHRALRKALLFAFPDRVAQQRPEASAKPGSKAEFLLFGGGSARLSENSEIRSSSLVVALDAEEQKGKGSRSGTVIRSASAIEVDWLLDLPGNDLKESSQLRWNPEQERVEALEQLRYGELVLDESVQTNLDSAEAANLLFQQAKAAGPRIWGDEKELQTLLARLDFAAEHFPESTLKPLISDELDLILEAACEGKSSFAELRKLPLLDHIKAELGAELSTLERLAPERLTLPGGRRLRLNYEPGKIPWAESRLQDFFGSAQTPLLGDRVPLVIHLLAPNRRAVQITQDLAGFWERHYPGIRKELMRRYPRHPWPENPLSANPPPPGGRASRR